MGLRCDITLSITLVSPFLMPGLDVAALGIDAAALRDDCGKGCPIIPADQVKGLLSAACTTLAEAGVEIDGVAVTRTLIGRLFGRPSDEDGGEWGAPQRGAIIFGDLTAPPQIFGDLTAPPQKAASFTRVSIDGSTGAAKNGALQTVELVAPLGQRVTFSGTATVRFDPRTMPAPATKTAAEWVAALLHTALGVIPAVGGLKTAGFGQVAEASATMTHAEPLALPTPATALPPVVRRYVHFDRRLLVDAERVADNVWKGQEIIPGAVFKGALAERLRLAGEDTRSGSPFGTALAAMRFSHAFPANTDGRPAGFTPPLSLCVYADRNDKLHGACALSTGGPDALPACAASQTAPAIPRFAPDWKDAEREQVLAAIGWPAPPSLTPLPRGHTAIGKDYVAADQKLFVDVGLSTHNQKWFLEIGQDKADPARFRDLMATLDQGLDGIGATGARATFTDPGDAPWDWPSSFDSTRTGDGLWAVTLATPALMFREPKPGMDAVAQYKDYWETRAGVGLEGAVLVDVFASQKLTGGYLGLRRRMYGHDRYYPFVLTQPGSVFLLSGITEEQLKALMRTGLPARAPEGVSLTWENCPYLPENGYGAILVNAIDHARLAPGVPLSDKEAS